MDTCKSHYRRVSVLEQRKEWVNKQELELFHWTGEERENKKEMQMFTFGLVSHLVDPYYASVDWNRCAPA